VTAQGGDPSKSPKPVDTKSSPPPRDSKAPVERKRSVPKPIQSRVTRQSSQRSRVVRVPQNAARGKQISNQAKHAEAETVQSEVVRLKPRNAEQINDLGDVLYSQKKYGEAETHFRDALRLEPNNSDYNYNVAAALAQQK